MSKILFRHSKLPNLCLRVHLSTISVVLEFLTVCMSLDNQIGEDPRKGVSILVEVGTA